MSPRTQPSTRRGAPEQRDAARRRRLLDAGLAVFGTEGYAASTIPGLCTRAGVGTTSFYAEFEAKEDLLLAVYDEVLVRVGGALNTALAEPPAGGLEERVDAAVAAFVTAATRDTRSARVQLVEVVGVSGRVERHRRSVLRGFAQVLVDVSATYVEAGQASRPITPAAGLAIVGATNELLVEWATTRGRRRPTPDTIRDTMRALVLGLLRAEP